MAPEYGATCGFFPVDDETLDYLTMSGRAPTRIALVETTRRRRACSATRTTPDPVFTDTLELDLADVVPSHGRARSVRRAASRSKT